MSPKMGPVMKLNYFLAPGHGDHNLPCVPFWLSQRRWRTPRSSFNLSHWHHIVLAPSQRGATTCQAGLLGPSKMALIVGPISGSASCSSRSSAGVQPSIQAWFSTCSWSCLHSLDTIERHLQQAVNSIQEWATRNGFRFADHKCKVVHAIVRSKFDYGCIVYGTASNTNLRQLDSIHNSGLRLTLGAFCTSPVSSLYTETNEAPLEERRLKLSMQYYVKTRACIDNPAHHALHEFDRTTRDLYPPRPNGRGGMTRPPAPPIGLKVEEAMTSAEINAELVCPLRIPNFPPGTHDYDPKRHDLIEGVS